MARKILLADDSVTAQNMGRKILADAGYEVFTVNNGSAALKKIAEAKPELIVLDVYMPGYSGLEVCQRLKEAQETSRIPILLTVGKLEPFKPEEAKRVRADGYIVKPFEASELLSALSKLEDKIVPGREPSKPGRFARANAAIEEGHYDKAMAVEEDSGWKNRIAFPSKKKKKAEPEEDGDDPSIYNAVNKDLRTVVERPSSPAAHESHEHRVNLEALAPEGLPKDVTPEEIAALAAAAAQIKGTTPESKESEPAPTVVAGEPASAAKAPVNQADIETIDLNLAAIRRAGTASTEPQPQPASPPAVIQLEVPKEHEAIASAPIAEPVVEHKQDTEKTAESPAVVSQEALSNVVPRGAELMAAPTSVEPQNVSPTSDGSGNGLASHETAADEPVTMAVAAGAEHAVIPARWTAVSVPLASDEVTISLEQEMQKAHAAFAAAEAHSAPVAAITEAPSEAPPTPAPPADKPIIEPEAAAAVAAVAPEASQAATAVASMATDAIHAAVKELEAVAAAYEAHRPFSSETAPSPAPLETSPASLKEAEPETPAPTPAAQAEPVTEPAPASEHTKQEAALPENSFTAEPVAPVQEVASTEQPAPAPVEHSPTAAPESSIETPLPSHPTETVVSGETSAGGKTVMSKKESEIAESTAAAWASWRRIRETGEPKPGSGHGSNGNEVPDAAMAVAAGAEKAPEDASSNPDSGEIASIVDSVLADLRPKIVEEISRKLGKKK